MFRKLCALFSRRSKSSPIKAAAYHEAGHAVVAVRSRYHSIIGNISADNYGAGAAYVTISKSKCRAAGKFPSEADPDIVRDFAVILKAGLAAEKMAAHMVDPSIIADALASKEDDALLLRQARKAGVDLALNDILAEAEKVLAQHWAEVRKLADLLVKRPVAAVDVLF